VRSLIALAIERFRTKEVVVGRIVVTEFISVDGVVEDPGSWTLDIDRGEAGDRFKLDELLEAEVQLIGRRTYESFAAAWPGREDEPGFSELATRMNAMPKYVYSSTLRDPTWRNTTVVTGEVGDVVRRLKGQIDGVILVAGSVSLVRALLDDDAIDEIRLMVFPVILGRGERLFGESASKPLQLVDAKTIGAGVQLLIYRPTDR
jgi:dihydrofolate reductase